MAARLATISLLPKSNSEPQVAKSKTNLSQSLLLRILAEAPHSLVDAYDQLKSKGYRDLIQFNHRCLKPLRQEGFIRNSSTPGLLEITQLGRDHLLALNTALPVPSLPATTVGLPFGHLDTEFHGPGPTKAYRRPNSEDFLNAPSLSDGKLLPRSRPALIPSNMRGGV
jgi:hypothetical protein